MKGTVRQIPSLSISRNDFVIIKGSIAKVLDISKVDTLSLKGLLGETTGREFRAHIKEPDVLIIESTNDLIRLSNYDYYHIINKKLLGQEVSFTLKYFKVSQKGYVKTFTRAELIR